MIDAGGKTIGLFPFILPFLLNGGGIILGHSNLPYDHFPASQLSRLM
jgi:hypothetical protein